MKAILFYLFIPFLYLFSLLPFPILYFISDILKWLLWTVVGYRKKIVLENIKNAFPEKSDEEQLKIAKGFYEFLSDFVVETAKMLTISQKELLKRCSFQNLEVFDKLYAEKKNVVAVMGHFGNWEWGNYLMSLSSPYQLYALYRRLKNPYSDQFILKMRNRFGAILVNKNDAYRMMLKNKASDELNVTCMIADQTPMPQNAYWTTFLNQDTAVYIGTEKIAKKLNYPVVYVGARKYKRGYYKVHLELLFENPAETEEGEITRVHTQKLEEDIRRSPETWLWSHRRWKYKRGDYRG